MSRPTWDEMFSKVPKCHPSPCIEVERRPDGKYGRRVTRNGVRKYPHQWAYIDKWGSIPDGHEIDHLCNNDRCVNWRHLEAVLQEVNKNRQGLRQTHCAQGHKRTNETAGVVLRSDGRMEVYCRVCFRERKRKT